MEDDDLEAVSLRIEVNFDFVALLSIVGVLDDVGGCFVDGERDLLRFRGLEARRLREQTG